MKRMAFGIMAAVLALGLFTAEVFAGVEASVEARCFVRLSKDGKQSWQYEWPGCKTNADWVLKDPIIVLSASRVYVGAGHYVIGLDAKRGLPRERLPVTGVIQSLRRLPEGKLEVISKTEGDKPASATNLLGKNGFERKVYIGPRHEGQLSKESRSIAPTFTEINDKKPSDSDLQRNIALFTSAAEQDPTNPRHLYNLGLNLRLANRPDEAVRAWDRMLMSPGANFIGFQRLAVYLETYNEYAMADRLYDAAYADYIRRGYRPEETTGYLFSYYINKAREDNIQKGDLKRAEHLIQVARGFTDYDDSTFLFSRAYEAWLRQEGRKDDARKEAAYREPREKVQRFLLVDVRRENMVDLCIILSCFISLLLFCGLVLVMYLFRYKSAYLEATARAGYDTWAKKFMASLFHPLDYARRFSFGNKQESYGAVALLLLWCCSVVYAGVLLPKLQAVRNAPEALLQREFGHPEALAHLQGLKGDAGSERLFVTGLGMQEAGEAAKAQGLYEKALAKRPQSLLEAKILNNLAVLFWSRGEKAKAQELLATGRQREAGSFPLRYNTGLLANGDQGTLSDGADQALAERYRKYLPGQPVLSHPDDTELIQALQGPIQINVLSSYYHMTTMDNREKSGLGEAVFFFGLFASLLWLVLLIAGSQAAGWSRTAGDGKHAIASRGKAMRAAEYAVPGLPFLLRGRTLGGLLLAWTLPYVIVSTLLYASTGVLGLMRYVSGMVSAAPASFGGVDSKQFNNYLIGEFNFYYLLLGALAIAYAINTAYLLKVRKQEEGAGG